jgi:hypothetical protein
MKTRADDLGTADDESWRAKLENESRGIEGIRSSFHVLRARTNFRETSPRDQNIKTGVDALGTAENESGRTKYENGT